MTRRTLRRVLLTGVLVWIVVQAGAAGAFAGQPEESAPGYVKYYVVAKSYQGAPENLAEIAARFLGSDKRAAEIFNLNAGRSQPDGGGLADPMKLHTGWVLVLPWDAVGDGVRYGQLPAGKKTTTKSTPTASPSSGPQHDSGRKSTVGPSSNAYCTAAAASSKSSEWAHLRMAPSQAWDRTRGNGVMVAVVDSGVDLRLPQLHGRVAVGADVTAGEGGGTVDCIGSGTAIAAIIAAHEDEKDAPTGIAPDATILPIRVVDKALQAKPTDQATAIEVAVSTGASVVAVGSFVDLTDPAVAAAVTNALSRDVLFVVEAPTGPTGLPAIESGAAVGALLSVGGVGADDQLAATYQKSTVDVVAPGIDVTSPSVGGNGTVTNSGTQYAVAFVAGQAALVRAAFPELTASEVKHRIQATADQLGDGQPDERYGWGMINPASAVNTLLPEESHTAAAPRQNQAGMTGRTAAIAATVLILFAAIAVLVLQSRQRMKADDSNEDGFPAQTPR